MLLVPGHLPQNHEFILPTLNPALSWCCEPCLDSPCPSAVPCSSSIPSRVSPCPHAVAVLTRFPTLVYLVTKWPLEPVCQTLLLKSSPWDPGDCCCEFGSSTHRRRRSEGRTMGRWTCERVIPPVHGVTHSCKLPLSWVGGQVTAQMWFFYL